MSFKCLRCKADIERSFRACPYCGEAITDFMRTYADAPIDGKYRVVDRLGAGGMGEVYKAEHTFLGTMRVIKVVRPQISDNQEVHDRFLREARAATRVQHPNVATLHDFSSLPDGSHYMVWEFIDGQNLAQRMRQSGPLPPRRAVQFIIEALHGLEAIHRAGIVHRDISPENLMISRDSSGAERVKIIDLGVAKVEGSEAADGATRAGIFVGKLRYASPEQLGFLEPGEKIDGRADLFAIAMVLYELLSGRPPFEATSPHEYVMLHARERQVKPLDLNGVPGGPELQSILERALERDRSRRFGSATEFATALEAVLPGLPDAPATTAIYDGDSTMKLTPTQSATSGTVAASTAPTVRTPLPSAPLPPQAAAPTVIETAAPGKKSSAALVVVMIAVAMLLGGAAVFMVLRNRETKGAKEVASASVTGTLAATSVDVVHPKDPLTTTVPADTAATVAPVTGTMPPAERPSQPKGPVIEEPAPEPEPREVPPVSEPEPEPERHVAAFVDGGKGDEDQNDALLSRLRGELAGVNEITIRGVGEGQLHLARILRDEVPDLQIGPGARVTIDFQGTLRPLGGGRKERSATATIRKNGAVIFRYELPPQVYRVGDTPPEAFARVLIDAFDR